MGDLWRTSILHIKLYRPLITYLSLIFCLQLREEIRLFSDMFIKVISYSMKRRKRRLNNEFNGDDFIENQEKIYVIEDHEGVFGAPNKKHKQVFSYTLLPTTLVDNIYLLVRDVVNPMRAMQVRSNRDFMKQPSENVKMAFFLEVVIQLTVHSIKKYSTKA